MDRGHLKAQLLVLRQRYRLTLFALRWSIRWLHLIQGQELYERGKQMPMEKHRYPENWDEIARGVKDRAKWICQGCGKQCRKPGEAFDTHRNTLTVAHLDHTPENCALDNLRALCAPCHLRYDAPRKAEDQKRKRREAKEADGQLTMFEASR